MTRTNEQRLLDVYSSYVAGDRGTVARALRAETAEIARRHRVIFRQPRGPLAAMIFGRTR